jgi:hypothetical protein
MSIEFRDVTFDTARRVLIATNSQEWTRETLQDFVFKMGWTVAAASINAELTTAYQKGLHDGQRFY